MMISRKFLGFFILKFILISQLDQVNSLSKNASNITNSNENHLLPTTNNTTTDLNEIETINRIREFYSRQIGLPANPLAPIQQRLPCECDKGVCKCCIGSALSTFGLKGCLEIVYFPEDFAFELRIRMNDAVLYRGKVSGKNPPPICVRPPRFGFVRACVIFYDIYFFGRNMHACMEVGVYFQGYELFSRTFDCLQFGARGVKIVKPEEGYPIRPSDVDIDQGDDEIEDYDENVVRSIPLLE